LNPTLLIQIIYSAASIQGLFLSLLLFRTKINQPANRILAILLLILSGHLILVGFDNRDFFLAFPHLSRVSWIIGSLYWPLIFLFVQYITQTQPDKVWKSFWMFTPFLILFAIMLPYFSMSAAEKRALLTNFEVASRDDFGWINQLVSVLHILFQTFIFVYYLRFEKKLYEEFSEVESLRIQWLKQFLLLTLAGNRASGIFILCPNLARSCTFKLVFVSFYWHRTTILLAFVQSTHATCFVWYR
jgi:hypothetical protein